MSQKKFENTNEEGKYNKQAGGYPASPQICPRFNKSFIKQKAYRLAQIRRNDEEIKNANALKSKQIEKEKSNPKSPSKRSPVKKEKEQKDGNTVMTKRTVASKSNSPEKKLSLIHISEPTRPY